MGGGGVFELGGGIDGGPTEQAVAFEGRERGVGRPDHARGLGVLMEFVEFSD